MDADKSSQTPSPSTVPKNTQGTPLEVVQTPQGPSQDEPGHFFKPDNGDDAQKMTVVSSDANAGDVIAGGPENTINSPSGSFEPVPPAHTIITHEQGPLDWTASAAVTTGRKSKAWYMGLIVCAVLVSVIVYFITKDVVSGVAIIIAALSFGAISTRRPRDLHYALDRTGITIGQKHFTFEQFRSFSIIDEGGYTSIGLMPLKRFTPLIAIAYDPSLHDNIVNALSAHLPLEEYKKDALDHITSGFKF
jgi:hypothetical protein